MPLSSLYPTIDFSTKFLCHICAKLYSKDQLFEHLSTCITQHEDQLPYEKAKEILATVVNGNIDAKMTVIRFNSAALDLYIRMNVVVCGVCGQYLYKGLRDLHCKGCKGSTNAPGSTNTFINLYKDIEMYATDKETSRKELSKLCTDMCNKRNEKMMKGRETKSPGNKLHKTMGDKLAKPKPLLAKPIKGNEVRVSLRPQQVKNNVASMKNVANNIKRALNDTIAPKFATMDKTTAHMPKHKNNSMILDKPKKPLETTETQVHHLESGPVSDQQLGSSYKLLQPTTSARVINEKRTNLQYTAEPDQNIILDQNNYLPITNKTTRYRSRFDITVSEWDVALKYRFNGLNLDNDGGTGQYNRYSDMSKRNIRHSNLNNDTSDNKPRSVSPKLQEIRRRSKIEIPDDFQQELKRNLSVVSENIKKIEEDRIAITNLTREQRSLSRTHTISQYTDTEDNFQELIKIDNVRSSPIDRKSCFSGVGSKDVGDKNVSCRYCDRKGLGDKIQDHERVCIRKLIDERNKR